MKKFIILLLIGFLWFSKSLYDLYNQLSMENIKLSSRIGSENLKVRSFQEKKYYIKNGKDNFGMLETLFETGLESSFHIDLKFNFAEHEKLRKINVNISFYADSQKSIKNFSAIFLSDAKQVFKCFGIIKGSECIITYVQGNNKSVKKFDLRYKSKLINPAYPFQEDFDHMKNKVEIPSVIKFINPLNFKIFSLKIKNIQEKIIVAGKKSSVYEIDNNLVKVRLFIAHDGELTGIRINERFEIAETTESDNNYSGALSFSKEFLNNIINNNVILNEIFSLVK